MNQSIKTKTPYIPLTQQKYCCVACAVQWILLRRKVKMVEQEIIAKELGLTIPRSVQKLFNVKMRTLKKKPKIGWGTREQDGNKLNAFFKKHQIPLKAKKIFYEDIKDPVKLISENLQKGNDIMAITNMQTIDKNKKYGHALIVTELILDKISRVVLGDPDAKEPKFWETELDKLIAGMDKKYGYSQGLYIISKK